MNCNDEKVEIITEPALLVGEADWLEVIQLDDIITTVESC